MRADLHTPLTETTGLNLALALASMERQRGYNVVLVRIRYTDGTAGVHLDGLVRCADGTFLIHLRGGMEEGDPSVHLALKSDGTYSIRCDGRDVLFSVWAEEDWVVGVDLTVFDRKGEPFIVEAS